MKIQAHQGLAPERWFKFTLLMQIANIGMDIERTIDWKKRGNLDDSASAFERALELLSLTIIDPKHRGKAHLKELTRVREVLLDYFMGDNEYGSTDESWQQYFYCLSYAAALERGR